MHTYTNKNEEFQMKIIINEIQTIVYIKSCL